jgi:hypothetical protein
MVDRQQQAKAVRGREMKTPLRTVGFAVVLVISLCSCAAFREFRESIPYIPIVKDTPYPSGIGHYSGGGGVAMLCQGGDYIGKHIDEALKKRKAYTLASVPERPDPEGKGKIHTRYVTDWEYFPPPLYAPSIPGTKEKWGYTFTVHTTDDGIITRCSATRQLLRRWSE